MIPQDCKVGVGCLGIDAGQTPEPRDPGRKLEPVLQPRVRSPKSTPSPPHRARVLNPCLHRVGPVLLPGHRLSPAPVGPPRYPSLPEFLNTTLSLQWSPTASGQQVPDLLNLPLTWWAEVVR